MELHLTFATYKVRKNSCSSSWMLRKTSESLSGIEPATLGLAKPYSDAEKYV